MIIIKKKKITIDKMESAASLSSSRRNNNTTSKISFDDDMNDNINAYLMLKTTAEADNLCIHAQYLSLIHI